MSLTTDGLNTAVSAVTAAYPYVALFDPSHIEVSLARQTSDWATSDGVAQTTSALVFSVPEGASVRYFALYDTPDPGSGAQGAYGLLNLPVGPYSGPGTYDITVLSVTAVPADA